MAVIQGSGGTVTFGIDRLLFPVLRQPERARGDQYADKHTNRNEDAAAG